jgi:hypothetical protein
MPAIQPHGSLREGITFTFRGVDPETDDLLTIDLVVAPLNFDAVKSMQNRIQAFGKNPTDDMESLVDAVDLGLGRNYKNVPRWLITQTIDLANMPGLMQALMDVSGLRRQEVEDAKKALATSPAATASETGIQSSAS